MSEHKNSSEELKEIRKSLNMTQKEFAKEFTCSVRTVQEWEQGRVEIKPHIMALFRKINEFSKLNNNERAKYSENMSNRQSIDYVSDANRGKCLEVEYLKDKHRVAMFRMPESYMCCIVDKNICVEIHDTKSVKYNRELLKKVLFDEKISDIIATAISECNIEKGGE